MQRKTSNRDSATQSCSRPKRENASQNHPSTESSVELKGLELPMPLSLSHRRGLPRGHDPQHSSCDVVCRCRPSAASQLRTVGCCPTLALRLRLRQDISALFPAGAFWVGHISVTRGFHRCVATFTPPLPYSESPSDVMWGSMVVDGESSDSEC